MKPNWLLLASLLSPLPALAQDASTPAAIAPSAQGDVSVTIYNGDVALVQDVRPLDLRSGTVRQDFPDVSAQIRPETVSLAVPDARIVEQNFDFDLLSPSSLMEKAVGETITLLRTNPATGAETRERAKVLAVNGGVVLQIGDRIEVLRDDGLPVRAIFDNVPPSLRARPTLSVTLDSTRAGTRPATLSYLSRGLGWKADYVALLDRKSGTIDVQGWVTLTNTTGTTFTNARTLLVAGEVGSNDDEQMYRPNRPRRQPLQQAGTETANREQLGDFYLYPLPERTTIADKQTKQVSFLDVKGAPATTGYRFVNGWLGTTEQPASAQSIVRFSNAARGGLGDALPAGTIRVYMRDARGQPQFTGEAAIDHTPQGSKIALATGDAFDVKVRAVVESRTRVNANRWQTKMRYTLTNATPAAVTVELTQGGLDWSDTRITDQSRQSERVDAGQAVWQVPVPANGSTTVTATFDTRY
ncbi:MULTISPECIES: DUF4139 domain-containing protein [unclassified Sphingomonas]|uniref:DUF4139 domain-containing protein n=1 Tax=unclassified Sphingomonas TaxID=196159 RepID=UPI0006F4C69E|nr:MULTISPECIES: DUF4139 domain-containing protein [unclassified Sphingomonas]KQM61868.1 hypothetical protein ASE65_06615 [Sphingomonas sp. Leaf16]KQN13141.1 hypothetical protein ASE81_07630 [Sphingomonas sp. Leaf29]KQN20027.1 hypothetical protein ASE83_07555 [Sphingomonas sp. Leaf32]